MTTFGPRNPNCDRIHAWKYRAKGESFREGMTRLASALQDTEPHFHAFRDILLGMRFLPAGRIQATMGGTRNITAFNCFVSGTLADSFVEGHGSIMERAKEAASTMRMGGGIGYDFSTLRPRGSLIKKLGSQSSGAISFMQIFNAVCLATSSSGHRRGAQMGVLRVDHPDIEEFIRAKQNPHELTGFNISVGLTDAFMEAVRDDREFPLTFGGTVYRTVWARQLWEMLMRSTYDWAEPGVLFIDRINSANNLRYCESISATNPCGEQPLPPYGACLLGSFNLTQYLTPGHREGFTFNWQRLLADIPHVVRAMDNVTDRTRYPLHEQEGEALSKRRMGLGITGAANAIEALGYPYGSKEFCNFLEMVLNVIRDKAYSASALLAKEKGSFPLYKPEYLDGEFIQNLPDDVYNLIEKYGVRNSHLLSIAPTGTISLAADNISSGIEPVFDYEVDRGLIGEHGAEVHRFQDYGALYLGVKGKRAGECTVDDHLNVLEVASRSVDSAVSKTCNVPQDISWEDFKGIYFRAWEAGCKGCTTYRPGGLRGAVLSSAGSNSSTPAGELESEGVVVEEVSADLYCSRDPITGKVSCE
jgi:ribonucleoside-diphosphate reductase alpha chain